MMQSFSGAYLAVPVCRSTHFLFATHSSSPLAICSTGIHDIYSKYEHTTAITLRTEESNHSLSHVSPSALTHPHKHAPSHTHICREHKRGELMQKRRDKENLTLEGGRIGVRRHRHMNLFAPHTLISRPHAFRRSQPHCDAKLASRCRLHRT